MYRCLVRCEYSSRVPRGSLERTCDWEAAERVVRRERTPERRRILPRWLLLPRARSRLEDVRGRGVEEPCSVVGRHLFRHIRTSLGRVSC